MKKTFLFCFLIFLYSLQGFAQNNSSVKDSSFIYKASEKPNYFNRAWGPIALGVISIDLMRDSTKYGLQDIARSFVSDSFYTHLDDYIHYAPILTMYTADLFKVPAKNSVWNQTKYLIMSELITSGIVLTLKHTLKIRRPNNGAYNAYPSGHTSQAFVQSQVLFNEFRETAPLLAASGFLFSIPTGALRVLKNKHWVPDVFMGAGIAMLVTNTIYHFEPLKNWNPFKNRKTDLSMRFIPNVNSEYVGGQFKLQF